MTASRSERRDFFLSYAGADREWAIWIATELENAGFTVELDEWDWPPGSDAIEQMNAALERADQVLALWSPNYFDPKSWAGKESSAAMYRAHREQAERLVPVVIEDVEPSPLFAPLVAIRLDGQSEEDARRTLINRLRSPRRPSGAMTDGVGPPGLVDQQNVSTVRFPGEHRGRGDADVPSREPLNVLPNSNLPLLADRFVGRTAEIDECRKLILDDGCRLLTIWGSGGSGKTRLAHALGRTLLERFGSHVYFIDLTTVTDPELVLSSITRALRIEAGDPIVDALKELFQEDAALVLLDNFEHVVNAAPTVGQLLDATSKLQIVVTSRELLGLRGERSLPLGALEPAEAAQLFIARASRPLALDEKVHELCKRAEYLPLAVELIAARAQWHSPDTLLKMLPEELLDLPDKRRDAAPRHHTLRDTMEWSYKLLQANRQSVFRRLSVFVGGFTLDLAAAVLWPQGTSKLEVADEISALLSCSLLNVELDPGRFSMAETLRSFALKKLDHDAANAVEVRLRHGEFFVEFAEKMASEFGGPDQAAAFRQLEAEQGNLAAALALLVRVGDAPRALRLAAALGHFWWSRDYREGWERLGTVLELPAPQALGPLRWQVLKARGQVAVRLGRLEEAEADFNAMLSIARNLPDARLEASSLARVALVHMEQAEFRGARSCLERAMSLLHDEDADIKADVLDSMGVVATGEARYDEARPLLLESRAAYERLGDEQGRAWVDNDLARLALAGGDIEAATRHATYALAVGQEQRDWGLIAWSRNYLGHAASRAGNYEDAREHHLESLRLETLLGDKRPIALALEGCAALAALKGDAERALTLEAFTTALREATRVPATKAEQDILDWGMLRARAAMAEPERDAAAAVGRQLSLERAQLLAREQ